MIGNEIINRNRTQTRDSGKTVSILSPQTERVFEVIVFQKEKSNICDSVEKLVIICYIILQALKTS